MAVATGLEPIPTESKSVVLPLHYATVVGIKGVGPLSYAYKAHALTVELDPIVRTKKVPGSLRPTYIAADAKGMVAAILAPLEGLEPSTSRLTADCSTD